MDEHIVHRTPHPRIPTPEVAAPQFDNLSDEEVRRLAREHFEQMHVSDGLWSDGG